MKNKNWLILSTLLPAALAINTNLAAQNNDVTFDVTTVDANENCTTVVHTFKNAEEAEVFKKEMKKQAEEKEGNLEAIIVKNTTTNFTNGEFTVPSQISYKKHDGRMITADTMWGSPGRGLVGFEQYLPANQVLDEMSKINDKFCQDKKQNQGGKPVQKSGRNR